MRSEATRAANPADHGRTVVVGLGQTGRSVARYLTEHAVALALVDSRSEPPGLASGEPGAGAYGGAPVVLGELPAPCLAGAVQLVVSPGVDLRRPEIAAAVAAGVPVLGDIELFARAARAPVVAVTGTNGKSTVTTLLGVMARGAGRRAAVGGNLGPPALDLLPPAPWTAAAGAPGAAREPAVYVLELSSFQLDTTESLRPRVAVLLNLCADHLDRYASPEAYFAAKARILRGAGEAVVNRDDPRVGAALRAAGGALPARGFTAGAPGPGDYGQALVAGETWFVRGGAPGGPPELLLPAREVGLLGAHNRLNVLAALAAADAAGFPRAAALAAVRAFRGLPHRCESLGRHAGALWVNDSKGTNVGAAVAAIEGLAAQGPLVWIGGGDGKGADFAPLAAALRGRARGLVLLGADAGRLAAACRGTAPVARVADMDEAVRTARALARPGDVVLLSPACASWDMFSSYEARGAAFAAAVAREARP